MFSWLFDWLSPKRFELPKPPPAWSYEMDYVLASSRQAKKKKPAKKDRTTTPRREKKKPKTKKGK